MGKLRKFFDRLMKGQNDSDLSFEELCGLLLRLDFNVRIKGDHHIFSRNDVVEIINLQPNGAKAKPYQAKQVRNIIKKYQLKIQEDNE